MKLRRELWFGFSLMGALVAATALLTPWSALSNGHVGLIMLMMIVVAILLGFPTAFTLMGMGVLFSGYAYYSRSPELALGQVLDLMVQRTYGVMSNELLIAVPLFVFMGYLVERAQLIDRLFRSLQLALQRVPGSLAVATVLTCAMFATATGIVGAVVTLMGLLALPAMLRAGYDVRVAAGAITAGGCLGILIPPSVLLILYGATAGVSVVQLYAGAVLPGLLLTVLYVGYVIIVALLRPHWLPPLAEADRVIPLGPTARALAPRGPNALRGLAGALLDPPPALRRRSALGQLAIAALPLLALPLALGLAYGLATHSRAERTPASLASGTPLRLDSAATGTPSAADAGALSATGLREPPGAELAGAQLAQASLLRAGAALATGLREPPGSAAAAAAAEPIAAPRALAEVAAAPQTLPAEPRRALPAWFWGLAALLTALTALAPRLLTWQRLEIFKLLLSSFFPLAILIASALGSILLGLTTPTEAAAVGALGGLLLAATYQFAAHWSDPSHASRGAALLGWARQLGGTLRESAFLTAKTSAMVCWLFVGSGIFSAAFALLGGQEVIERWVLGLDLSPLQFTVLAQAIIFVLGWPLEWTEIIVIFMPIFLPLLGHFHVDPLFFGLLVALNLQTAFLSPPVAMAAFYLKGVAPPHVRLSEIFSGMLPFMGIQVLAVVLLYAFPQLGLWLPRVLYP